MLGALHCDACSPDYAWCVGFQHYIATRFYVDNEGHGKLPNENWLVSRVELFKKVCLPSVAAQSDFGFTWLVFCDVSSPTWLMDFFESLNQPYLRVVRISSLISGGSIRGALEANSEDRILTTRLDSDDALANDFVSRLYDATEGHTVGAFNFTYGLQITPFGLLWTRSTGNPFISVLDNQGFRSRNVFDFDHQEVSDAFHVQQIHGRPAWLQVIHGGNVANQAHGLPVLRSRYARTFPLAGACSRFRLIAYLRNVQPMRYLMLVVARRVLRKNRPATSKH